jgi:hypothetical protein
MSIRHALAALAGLCCILSAPLALAQTPADFSKFTPACMAATPFLLGEVPPEVKAEDVLTPLCGCLVSAFAPLSQADVDVLTADLSGTSTEETHKAHGNYERLQEQAREGLNNCFASPEVSSAMKPPEAPAADTPAPGAEEAPATPAQ